MNQLLALATALILVAPISIDLQALLPSDGTPPGWKKDGDAEKFVSKNIGEHLGTAAEAYINDGLKEMIVQYYRHGGKEIKVEICDMGSAKNAQLIFNTISDGKATGNDLGQGSLVESNQIAFYSKNYLIHVSSEESGEDINQAMAALAMSVDAYLF